MIRSVLNPLLVIAYGGIAVRAAIWLRVLQIRYFGEVLPSWRWKFGDHERELQAPPRPPSVNGEEWNTALPLSSELLPITLGENCAEIEERVEAGDHDVAWLRQIAPPGLLKSYLGAEGAQIPRYTRIGLALCASDTQNPHLVWPEKIKADLRRLASDGALMHRIRTSWPDRVTETKTTVLTMFGNAGGTGTGAALVIGAAVADLSAELDMRVASHAVVLGGHYRADMSFAGASAKLAHALDLDMNHAMSSGNAGVGIPCGQEAAIEWPGRLFDSVSRFEAWGRFSGETEAFAVAIAESMLYTYASRSAADLQRARGNDEQRPRIRMLLRD